MYSREKRSSFTHQNTNVNFPNQEPSTSYSSKPSPQGGTFTIKRNHKLPEYRIQKGHPKHSNLNKMKRQRNTQQVREHDKCPPNQTKEEEIMNLPGKEF